MRFGAVATMTVFLAAGFVTFVPGCQLIDTRSDASSSGGTTSSTSSSGGDASGGSKSSGGSVASGGTTAKGGSGGASDSGGAGSGGSVASGGTTAKGGSGGGAGAGGVIATGGVAPKGGNGGTGAGATGGGATARGGAAGATTSVGNCTDEPPPGQTPTCEQWVGYNVCSQSWMANYCNKSCGRCSGSSQGGAGGSGGARNSGGSGGNPGSGGTSTAGSGGGGGSGPGTTNPPITGTQGWASRYWDCCKPSCGWSGNSNPPVPSCGKDGKTRVGADQKNGCEGGGSAFECYDFHPWYDAATNMAYGFAAKNGVSCGACFMLQFTGDSHNGGANPGAAALKGQQMVVQAINIGGIESNQFDLLIPGGGVGAMNGCSTQWGSSTDLGVQYGGLLSECKADAACMKGKCESVFGSMPDLKAGCDWFTGWFSSADNPNLIYKQVSCPDQLKSKTGISR